MKKFNRGKTRLLLGASTLLAITSTGAMAQTASVQIAGGDVTNATGDSVQTQDQANTNDILTTTNNTDIDVSTGTLLNSSAVIDAGRNTAAAVGNNAALAISDTDSAATATTSVLATVQTSIGASAITVVADANDTSINLFATDVTGSSASVANSADAATATGNSATQSLTLSSTTLTLGTAVADADTVGTATAADLDVSAAIAVGSLQANTNSVTRASNLSSTLGLDADNVSGSALTLGTNTQESSATGSTAANAIRLTGTTVGVGVAIASQQDSDATSAVTGATTASASLTADAIVSGSTATVSGNRIQARALTANTSNLLSVDATSMTLPAADTSLATTLGSTSGIVRGAFATVNDQSVANTTTATVVQESVNLTNSTSAAMDPVSGLIISGNVSGGSAIANDANTISARAQAAVATNSTTLAIDGTLGSTTPAATGGVSNAAVIASTQNVAGGANVLASTTGGYNYGTIATDISGLLDDSSVTTSSNRVQAIAEATNATNALAVSATTLSAAASSANGAVNASGVIGSDAVVNSAFAVANRQVTGNATVQAKLENPLVGTVVSGNVSDSSIDANGNVLEAFGSANKASNSVTLAGTTVTTDASAVNFQTSNAQVTARFDQNNSAAVAVGMGSDITNSDVSVNGNLARGSAIGNVGTNMVSASATTLNGGGTDAQAEAIGTSATGDFSLANKQVLESNSASTTSIMGTFSAMQESDMALTDSRISVSSNAMFGEALGNTATNRLAVSATSAGAGVDPTAVLNSTQSADADIDATSWSTVRSVSSADGSSIALNSNSNTALGVVNNAVNSVTASALTLDGSATVGTTNIAVNADYALASNQGASGTVDVDGRLSVNSADAYDMMAFVSPDAGTVDSNVSIAGNALTSEGSANRVSNQMAVSANNAGATAMISNAQDSSADVIVLANGYFGYRSETSGLAGGLNAANASSIAIEGNNVASLARGNSASNVLNYAVGSTYSAPTTAANFVSQNTNGNLEIAATAGVLNNQFNSGDVSANGSAEYRANLNSGSGTAALNSNVSMANNSASATAYGNIANNSVSMLTFGAGVPSSAVSSNQVNTGTVSAVSYVNFGTTAVNTTGSAVRSTGNSATATAVGNNSVNTIGGGN